MKNLIVAIALVLGFASVASAQSEFTPAKVRASNNSTNIPTLLISTSDTTVAWTLKELGVTSSDTTFAAVVRSVDADTVRLSWYVQFLTEGNRIVGQTATDSLVYNNLATATGRPAKGMSLWGIRAPGTVAARIIITTGATLNQGGLPTQTHKKLQVGWVSPKASKTNK